MVPARLSASAHLGCFPFYERAQSRVLSCGYASKRRGTAPLRTQLSKDGPYAAADTSKCSLIQSECL
jgi:hypothetical protein